MKLHHIGRVVKDLEEARKYYKETFGLEALGEPEVDPIQKVEVLLLDTGYGNEATIELICPTGEDSPIYKFLQKKGEGLHHLSFEVEDIQQAITELREKGALILGDVVPSKAHRNPSVWLYTRTRELVELIERGKGV
ncbi:MAG: VOC family protein [bacterium]|nr:VOC family protein [bacterium]